MVTRFISPRAVGLLEQNAGWLEFYGSPFFLPPVGPFWMHFLGDDGDTTCDRNQGVKCE